MAKSMSRSKSLMTLSALALALGSHGLVSPAVADELARGTDKTLTYEGMVSAVDPTSSTIVVRSDETPSKYTFSKETLFVDHDGHAVDADTIRNTPVTMTYHQEGDRLIVTKVEVQHPSVRKETTTTTESK